MSTHRRRSSTTDVDTRTDKRDKATVALDSRERADLDYLMQEFGYASSVLVPLPALASGETAIADGGPTTGPSAAQLQSVADYSLRSEYKHEFGTVDLPTDKANVLRLGLRVLAQKVRAAKMRAEVATAMADSEHRAELAGLATESDAGYADSIHSLAQGEANDAKDRFAIVLAQAFTESATAKAETESRVLSEPSVALDIAHDVVNRVFALGTIVTPDGSRSELDSGRGQ